jgi:general stress protein 26
MTHGNLQTTQLSLERVIEIARSVGTGMLVTDSDEGFRSRPMSVAEVTDDGELWFLTSLSSPKIEELTRNPHVLVVLASSGKFLSLTGTASLERDPVKVRSLWSEAYRVWFKDERDPDLVLLRIDPSWAEYWDQSGWNGLKYAARAAKAYVKGEQLREVEDVRAHAKVRL